MHGQTAMAGTGFEDLKGRHICGLWIVGFCGRKDMDVQKIDYE